MQMKKSLADLTNGKTLAIKGDENVKFVDVVSGDIGMTMMVMLGGGSRSHLRQCFRK